MLHVSLKYVLLGLRTADFPKALSEQNSKATEAVRELIKKVLNREEEFTIILRKSNQRRYVKDSTEVIIPPLEVRS